MKSSEKPLETALRQVVVLFTTVTVLLSSFAFASSASASDTRSCSEGGLCVIGDIGPGGGTVFFVKSAGAFEASKTVTRYVDMGDGDLMAINSQVGVALTEEENVALTFDYLEVAHYGGVAVRKWANGDTWPTTATIDTKIGSGESGTLAIMTGMADVGEQTAGNNAAYYANSYSNNGLDDWFLASQDELALVTIRHFDDALGLNDPVSEDISRHPNQTFYGWTTTPTRSGFAAGVSITDMQWIIGLGLGAGADASVLPIRSFSFQALPQVPVPDNSSGGVSAPQVIPEPVIIPERVVAAEIPDKPQKLRFGIGQTSFTSSQRSVIEAIASAAGEGSSFVVTGGVGYLPGPSTIDMLALASQRATVIKQELVSEGVGKSLIRIKTRIFEQGKPVKTKVRVIPAPSE
jgi:hypothetical protein